MERDADHVTEAVLTGEDRRRVTACLDGLTDIQRECIELAYYQGLTYVQVSERLSANLATVKSRIRDGLRACAIAWGAVMTTQTHSDDLLDLAVPYALDAVSDAERDQIESRLAAARCRSPTPSTTRCARSARPWRWCRQPMPPIRRRTCASVYWPRWPRTTCAPCRRRAAAGVGARRCSAAAAVAIGLTARRRRHGTAADAAGTAVHRSAGVLGYRCSHRVRPDSGRRHRHRRVLQRPQRRGAGDERRATTLPGTVYQMAGGPQGAKSAGTMDAKAVAPSTTAVLENLGDSKH